MIANVEYGVGQVIVEFEYNKDLIAAIKDEIPIHARSWDQVRKAWIFVPDWWDAARRVIEEHADISD